MSTQELVISVLVFLAVTCVVWGIYGMIKAERAEDTERVPSLFRFFAGGIFFFGEEIGGWLEKMSPRKSAGIGELLARADIPLDIKDFFGARILFGLIGVIIGCLIAFGIAMPPTVRMICIGIFGLVGFFYPEMCIRKMAEKRADEIMHHLPFAIDLISSSMNAGLDFSAAVRYLLSIGGDDVLRKEFALFLREVELGKTRLDAFADMRKRIGIEEFSRFAAAIAYGMDSGSSIIEIMRIQAEEMRRIQFSRAERQAAKAPSKMIVPMAIFVFPSMFIIIFTPIILRLRDSGVLSMIGK